MNSTKRVKEFLQKQTVKLEVLEFPQGSTQTSEMAAQALGVEPAQIAKTLLFIGKKGNLLVVTCGDKKVDTKKLKEHYNDKFRFAKADEVRELTGFSPGGVCPFALKTDIPIVVDTSIARFSVVYAAAGNSGSAVPVTLDQLLAITKGEYLSVC